MKRIECTIETFKKLPKESEPWAATEWTPENEGAPPEEATYEPQIVEGGLDAEDIQFYMGIRDDRVGVMFKNGSLISLVCTLQEFRVKLSEVGL